MCTEAIFIHESVIICTKPTDRHAVAVLAKEIGIECNTGGAGGDMDGELVGHREKTSGRS